MVYTFIASKIISNAAQYRCKVFVKWFRFMLAVPARVLVAAVQVRDEIPIMIFLSIVRAVRIRVHDPLRHQRKSTQHADVPLHKMLERMCLRILEVISAIEPVEPGIEEEVRPVSPT